MAGAAGADRIPGAHVDGDRHQRQRARAVRARRGSRPGRRAAAAGTPVTRLEVVGPTLDDVFLNLTGRSLRESNETTGPIDAAVNADAAGDEHEGEAA